MTHEQKIARIDTDNDHDRAECDEWMRNSDEMEKALVLQAIMHDYDDPVMEIMSRFAQLAFAEAMVRLEQSKDGSQ